MCYSGPRRIREREREKRIRNVLEKHMPENFPKLKKDTDIQVQKAQMSPNKIHLSRSKPKHIIIKIANLKIKNSTVSKMKTNSHIQRNYQKTISLFLCRKIAGQKGAVWDI